MNRNPHPPADALQGKSTRPKKKCDNCGKDFPKLNPEGKPWKKNKRFCDDNCKAEFHRFGSAFGPLKETVSNIAREEARKAARATDEGLARLLLWVDRVSEQLTAMEHRIEGFAKQVSQIPRLSREIDDARTELRAVELSIAGSRTLEALRLLVAPPPDTSAETSTTTSKEASSKTTNRNRAKTVTPK
jgi:hypothetical protein